MSWWLLWSALALSAWSQRPALPEFVSGDQCLFCHRNDIGPAWAKNRHNLTIRPREGSEEDFLLGAGRHSRQLKKTGHGRFALAEPAGWNQTAFGERCAGCHTTAVDATTRRFAQWSIDCYACHGVVDLEHSNDVSLILLSKKRREPLQIASICGSCHLRGARSKTTGLPYPYHFVPGDDLFADFVADWAMAVDEKLNAADRHVYRNVRDIVQGKTETTCLSCHQVHAGSSQKHRRVLTSAACLDCHDASGPKSRVKRYVVTSSVCQY